MVVISNYRDNLNLIIARIYQLLQKLPKPEEKNVISDEIVKINTCLDILDTMTVEGEKQEHPDYIRCSSCQKQWHKNDLKDGICNDCGNWKLLPKRDRSDNFGFS